LSSPRPSGRLRVDEPAPGVARLTISNPQRSGALDHPILDAFASTVPELDARCVIITGEGGTFSAGYDLAGLPDGVLAEEADRLVAHPFAAAIDAVEDYPYPTLAALNGHTIVGGLAQALKHFGPPGRSQAEQVSGRPRCRVGAPLDQARLGEAIDRRIQAAVTDRPRIAGQL